jgi:hypothetical protein
MFSKNEIMAKGFIKTFAKPIPKISFTQIGFIEMMITNDNLEEKFYLNAYLSIVNSDDDDDEGYDDDDYDDDDDEDYEDDDDYDYDDDEDEDDDEDYEDESEEENFALSIAA